MNKTLLIKPGTKVTAMGLGQFGGQIAAIRHCANLGADVLVTDQSSAELLADSVSSLQDCPNVSFRFGPHCIDDFVDADLILASPAVKPSHPCLLAAEKNNIPIITEIELFLANCSGKIIAVSGTVGKSTTASMIEHLLSRLDIKVRLGGNIGKSLLPFMNEISDEDWTILELSSFQLHWLSRGQYSFDIAVLTNYFPHHLDWHGDEQSYRECKQSLFRNQNAEQLAVLPVEFQGNENWQTKATQVYFGGEDLTDLPADWPTHGKQNAAAAFAVIERICDLKGIDIQKENLISLLADFRGLPHRMECITEKNGRWFINDSKATCPQSTIAAIRSMKEPTRLIVGGASILDELGELITELNSTSLLRGIACVGPTGQQIYERLLPILSEQKSKVLCQSFPSLQLAVQWCWENSKPDETILLSPACPSYDEFHNYEQRGYKFAEYVRELK